MIKVRIDTHRDGFDFPATASGVYTINGVHALNAENVPVMQIRISAENLQKLAEGKGTLKTSGMLIRPYTPFIFPTIDGAAPLNTVPFFAWLMAQAAPVDTFLQAVTGWLNSLGWTNEKIPAELLETCRHIFSDSHNQWRVHNHVFNFNELFSVDRVDVERGLATVAPYHMTVRTENDWGKYYVTQKLFDLVEALDLIKELSADNFYFEVIRGNRLYIKFQQIIGSRAICTVNGVN